MPLQHNHAGFNISGNKLQLVEIVHNEGGLYFENVDEEWLESPISIETSESQLISILQNSFNQIILRKSLKTRNVSFALPFSFFNVLKLPFDETLTKKDLIDQFKWELSILYPPSSPDDYVVKYLDLSKSNLINKNEAIVISIKKEIVKLLKSFCDKNNLTLKFIDNSHLASSPFIKSGKNYADNLEASMYLDNSELSILVFESKFPIYFNSIKLKENEDFSVVLAKEFSLMKKIGIERKRIAQFYYAGILDADSQIKQIEKEFSTEFKRINPFLTMKIAKGENFTKFGSVNGNSFTPSAGIALRLT